MAQQINKINILKWFFISLTDSFKLELFNDRSKTFISIFGLHSKWKVIPKVCSWVISHFKNEELVTQCLIWLIFVTHLFLNQYFFIIIILNLLLLAMKSMTNRNGVFCHIFTPVTPAGTTWVSVSSLNILPVLMGVSWRHKSGEL